MTWRSISLCVCLSGAAASGAFASESDSGRLVHRVIDRATGAEIRVYQPSSTLIRVQVSDGTIVIRRDLQPQTSVTTIVTPVDEIRLTVDRRGMTVYSVTAPGDSAAIRRALELLGQLSVPLESPVGQSLLATRALLLSATGDESAAHAVLARGRAALETIDEPTSNDPDEGDLNPTQCWEMYSREAIAAYMDFEDCLDGCPWYNPFCSVGCQAVYDMRAIGAFAWWLRCVGLGVRD